MNPRSVIGSIDAYVARYPSAVQKVLRELRALVRKAAPGATERISYGIPTFDLNGRSVVYFAAWKKHISFYPVTGVVAKAMKAELEPYKRGKGTVQFPLGKPMPKELIRRFVKLRVAEVTGTLK